MPRTATEIRAAIERLENKDRLSYSEHRTLDYLRAELAQAPDEPPAPKPTYAALLATPLIFAHWLKRQRPERRFLCRHTQSCPLAEFLTQESGRRTEVHSGTYVARDEGPPYHYMALPDWAQAFADAVDAAGDSRTPLSPAECMHLLRRVEAGME